MRKARKIYKMTSNILYSTYTVNKNINFNFSRVRSEIKGFFDVINLNVYQF